MSTQDSSTTTTTTTTTATAIVEKKDDGKDKVQEDLSRMEGTYGKDVIRALKKLKVCIIGLRGLGIETAKNLILAGPELVDVHDDAKCEAADLGCNFYLTDADIQRGTSRATACLAKLQELNPNCEVKQHSGHFEPAHLDKYDVVVCCDDRLPEQALKDFNDHCRNHKPKPIAFMVGHIQGATGSIFTDFGPTHKILDTDGEPTRTLIIDSILNNQDHGRVTIDGKRHLLSDGDLVKFSEVLMKDSKDASEAITYSQDDTIVDINQTHRIKTVKGNPAVFTIGSTKGLGEYERGGVINQIKEVKTVQYNSFEDELKCPTLMDSYIDFTKFGRAPQLHFARLALYEFLAKHDRVPNYHSDEDAKQVIEIAKDINARHKKINEKADSGKKAIVVDTIEEKVMKNVSYYAKCEVAPMAALFGGVLAQEIIKHSGKYTPIKQWFHFDAFEILGDKPPEASKTDPNRYDHQVAIFGKKWQDAWEKKNVFVVGCGALGCEYLKMIAMTGLGVKGGVHCTDDDTIELSNLSRQFLFRRKHVDKMKSTSAAGAVIEMNPDLEKSLHDKSLRVEPKSEDTFNDAWWQKIDFVINALDNIHARKYIDGKCVIYGKPLFESGTLGTKANNVVVLPGQTPSYSEGATSGEGQGIAQCTLRNFPFLPLHCIEWGKIMFDEWFVMGPDKAADFLKDKNAFFEKVKSNPREELTTLKITDKWIDLATKPSVDKCIQYMLDIFLSNFRNKIKDLIHHFPLEYRTTDNRNGEEIDTGPFWHGHKRFPQVAEWDANKDEYVKFFFHSVNIMIDQIFDLKTPVDEAIIKKKLGEITVPEWVLSEEKIDMDEDEKEETEEKKETPVEIGDDEEKELEALRAKLQALDASAVTKLKAADFEKDDAKNHHIDIITSATNLRAWNYKLEETSTQKVRMIAGKIIPAIATTTACITGFIGLEVMKHVRGLLDFDEKKEDADLKKEILERHRMTTINLAVNNFTLELLPDPKKTKSGLDAATQMELKAIPEGYTCWDFVRIDKPDLTVQEFIDEFKTVHHDCKLTMLADDEKVYYNDMDDPKKLSEKLIDVVKRVRKIDEIFPPGRDYIIFTSVSVEDKDEEEGQTPAIRWKFK